MENGQQQILYFQSVRGGGGWNVKEQISAVPP